MSIPIPRPDRDPIPLVLGAPVPPSQVPAQTPKPAPCTMPTSPRAASLK